MKRRMDTVVSYLKNSRLRLPVLRALGRSITTTNKIASQTKLPVTTVRAVINDLVGYGLVKKAVSKARRPMIYGVTELGRTALKMKDAKGSIRWKGSSKQKRLSRRVKDKF